MIQELLGIVLEDRKNMIPVLVEAGVVTSAMDQHLSPATSSSTTSSCLSSHSQMMANKVPPAAASSMPAPAEPLRCPRCNSTNTKFCYYNNYNLTQPRHFCKTCRRYWTKGGALRNVPIGGGCRKPKPVPLSTARPFSSAAGGAGATRTKTMASLSSELPVAPIACWGVPGMDTAQLMALLRATSDVHSSNSEHCPRTVGDDLRTMTVGQLPDAGLYSSLWRSDDNGHAFSKPREQPASSAMPTEPIIPTLAFQTSPSAYSYKSSDRPMQAIGIGDVVVGASRRSSFATAAASVPIMGSSLPVSSATEQANYWNPVMSAWSDLPAGNGTFP